MFQGFQTVLRIAFEQAIVWRLRSPFQQAEYLIKILLPLSDCPWQTACCSQHAGQVVASLAKRVGKDNAQDRAGTGSSDLIPKSHLNVMHKLRPLR